MTENGDSAERPMDTSIFRFILRHSKPQQGTILVLTLISFPFLYLTLELPKRIINEALGDNVGWARQMLGEDLDKVTLLLILCFGFLFLVGAHGSLKYFMNVFSGRLGEQMLRRLRYELYGRVLRFPLPQFKKISQGETIQMITAEVEPLGGFIGIAISTPAFMGGMLLVYLGFIFAQNFFLGLAAISLYPVQIYVIPRLQKRVNALSKMRVREVRRLAEKVGESVTGVVEIHAHDTSAYERADVSERLGRIYTIRYEIFRRKFAIKFLNNFLAQLTPFFFYSIGGYLILSGLDQPPDQQVLTLGALVAVLAAYKDLNAPWKELLAYYQIMQDVRIKYEQVVEQFDPPGMLTEALQNEDLANELAGEVSGELEAANLSYSEDGRTKLVEGANFNLDLNSHIAISGGGGSGKEEMTMLLSRLLAPSGGSLRLSGKRLSDYAESFTGRKLSYVSPTPFMFTTTVRENLYYGLKHRPLHEAEYEGDVKRERENYISDAHATGNSPDALDADWIDYSTDEVDALPALEAEAIKALLAVDMADDMYDLGLRGSIDPAARPKVAERILSARQHLRKSLADQDMSDLIEPFDENAYNNNASLAENLLFGTPCDDRFDLDNLADHPYVREVLLEVALTNTMVSTGREVADTMVELFSGLPPGHEFFEQYGFIGSDELPDYQAILARTASIEIESYKEEDRDKLMSLPFKLIPARHRLGLITDEIKEKILEARRQFRANLPEEMSGAVEFFDQSKYNAASSLQDNILFGKIAYGQAQAAQRLTKTLGDALNELNLRDDVMLVGLDYPVGVSGSRLSAAQRQKLGIARSLIKRPDVLILNDAITNLDGATQRRVIDNVLREMEGRGVIWAVPRARFSESFAKILVMRAGKVVEQGSFEDLNKDGSALHDLLQSE